MTALPSPPGVAIVSVRQSSDWGRVKSPMTAARREAPCGAMGPCCVASPPPSGRCCGGWKRLAVA